MTTLDLTFPSEFGANLFPIEILRNIAAVPASTALKLHTLRGKTSSLLLNVDVISYLGRIIPSLRELELPYELRLSAYCTSLLSAQKLEVLNAHVSASCLEKLFQLPELPSFRKFSLLPHPESERLALILLILNKLASSQCPLSHLSLCIPDGELQEAADAEFSKCLRNVTTARQSTFKLLKLTCTSPLMGRRCACFRRFFGDAALQTREPVNFNFLSSRAMERVGLPLDAIQLHGDTVFTLLCMDSKGGYERQFLPAELSETWQAVCSGKSARYEEKHILKSLRVLSADFAAFFHAPSQGELFLRDRLLVLAQRTRLEEISAPMKESIFFVSNRLLSAPAAADPTNQKDSFLSLSARLIDLGSATTNENLLRLLLLSKEAIPQVVAALLEVPSWRQRLINALNGNSGVGGPPIEPITFPLVRVGSNAAHTALLGLITRAGKEFDPAVPSGAGGDLLLPYLLNRISAFTDRTASAATENTAASIAAHLFRAYPDSVGHLQPRQMFSLSRWARDLLCETCIDIGFILRPDVISAALRSDEALWKLFEIFDVFTYCKANAHGQISFLEAPITELFASFAGTAAREMGDASLTSSIQGRLVQILGQRRS